MAAFRPDQLTTGAMLSSQLNQSQKTSTNMPSIGQRKATAGISALIMPSDPKVRKYKDDIRDGASPVPLIQYQTSYDDDKDLSESIQELQMNFDMNDFRAKLKIADALAQASEMTSPAARRRLEARKVEMDMNQEQQQPGSGPAPVFLNDENEEYTPPKELLIYIMRMGSFNSAPKINNVDYQDDGVQVPNGLSIADFVYHCKMMRGENRPQLLTRAFLKQPSAANLTSDVTDGLRMLNLHSVVPVSQTCSAPPSSPTDIRILQWNILSQSLGQFNDGFVNCPEEALTWECRKYQILQEIVQTNPDLICLQEVDHFKFIQGMLSTLGYDGMFFPKPDSPCLYIEDNNGPDGCAIFYRRSKFELVQCMTRILEVWRVQSNQVAIAAILRARESNYELCLGTTHLKARHGALLSKLRNEQGKDLLRFIKDVAGDRPILLSGDFNAEPIEPVYSTIINNKDLGLSSAYADLHVKSRKNSIELPQNHSDGASEKSDDQPDHDQSALSRAEILASQEPKYTTWKIREEGEVCHCIDYVFYSKDKFTVNNCLEFPLASEVGKHRVPSFQYPSDHFSLVCDFRIRTPTPDDHEDDNNGSPAEN